MSCLFVNLGSFDIFSCFEFRVAEEEEHDAVSVDEPVQTRKAEESGDQNAPDNGGEPLSEQLNVDPSSAVTPFKKKTAS